MKMSQLFLVGIICAVLLGTIAAFWIGGKVDQASQARLEKMLGEKKPSSEHPIASNPAAEPEDQPAATSATSADVSRYEALLAGLTVFVLAIFIGFEVVTKVPPTLHTPLMSGSNAISGITIVGAIIVAGVSENLFSSLLCMVAVALAAVNVIGGFWVTHRMLSMFKKR